MKEKIDLIVARYNEDLNWLEKVPKKFNIIIYNKGLDDIKYPFIKLPNIGRESHTYLYHILNNYNNLADITIFCQGDSIFHSPDFLKLLKSYKKFEPIQPLSAFYWPSDDEPPFYIANPPIPVRNATNNLHINKCKIHVEYMDNNFVTKYPYYYNEPNYSRFININKKIYNTSNVLEFNTERFLLKNIDITKLIPVCYAALFSVTKDVIRENSIDFYNNIKNCLLYDVRDGLDNTKLDHGQLLEKLWLLIFNYKKNNKNYLDLNCKDYLNYDSELIIKNNSIYFKLFVITCKFLNIEFYINNILYVFMIEGNFILFKSYNKGSKIILYKNNITFKKEYKNKLKDMSNLIIKIIFNKNNNTVNIHINNMLFLNHKLRDNINKVENAKIFSLSKDNILEDYNK